MKRIVSNHFYHDPAKIRRVRISVLDVETDEQGNVTRKGYGKPKVVQLVAQWKYVRVDSDEHRHVLKEARALVKEF